MRASLLVHNAGYSSMCGHGVIAVVTIAVERGLIKLVEPTAEIVLATPAGPVRARAELRERGKHCSRSPAPSPRVASVSFVNVPSFVLHAGFPLRVGNRELPVDVAFGGAFYAIVDSEFAGVPVRPEYLLELRKLGMQIKDGVESALKVVHPTEAGLRGAYGTIVAGMPSNHLADLRNATISADAQIDRSPCGTGTAAVMAVVDAMGLLSDDRPFVHESIIGTLFKGSVEDRTTVGDHLAILSRIEGAAWITGEHEFLIDDEDPLSDGFKLN